MEFPVEHDLSGGVAADFFVGEEGHQPFLHRSKAALDLALGLRAGGDQMGDAQCGEGALELRTGIAVIRHRIVAEEAEAVGIDHHGQAVLEQEAAKMLEMIPGGVGGDKDRAQEFSRMIVNGQEQGLLGLGWPPLVDGRIVLPQFIDP